MMAVEEENPVVEAIEVESLRWNRDAKRRNILKATISLLEKAFGVEL